MDIVLITNGLDLSAKVSTYATSKEITFKRVVTTMDNVEHPDPGYSKDVVTFSLLPMTELEGFEVYSALSSLIFDVTFTSQYDAEHTVKKTMRVTSNLESTFLLMSVDGKRRYRGGEISLREL